MAGRDDERSFQESIENTLKLRADKVSETQRQSSLGSIAGSDLDLDNSVVIMLIGDTAINGEIKIRRELVSKIGNDQAVDFITIDNSLLAKIREKQIDFESEIILEDDFWSVWYEKIRVTYDEIRLLGEKRLSISMRKINVSLVINACDFDASVNLLGIMCVLFQHKFSEQFITIDWDLFLLLNETDVRNKQKSYDFIVGLTALQNDGLKIRLKTTIDGANKVEHYGIIFQFLYILGERDMRGVPCKLDEHYGNVARLIVLSNIANGIQRQNIAQSVGRDKPNLVSVAYSSITSPIEGIYYYGLAYFAEKLFGDLQKKSENAAPFLEKALRLEDIDRLAARQVCEPNFNLPKKYHNGFDIAYTQNLREAEKKIYHNDLNQCFLETTKKLETDYIKNFSAGIRAALSREVLNRAELGFIFAISALNKTQHEGENRSSIFDNLENKINRNYACMSGIEADIDKTYGEDIYKILSKENFGFFCSEKKKTEKVEAGLRRYLIDNIYQKKLELCRLRVKDRLFKALLELCRAEHERCLTIIKQIDKIKDIFKIISSKFIKNLRTIFVEEVGNLCAGKIDAIMQKSSLFSSSQVFFSSENLGALSNSESVDVRQLIEQIINVFEKGIINSLIKDMGSFGSILQMADFEDDSLKRQMLNNIYNKSQASLIYSNYLAAQFAINVDQEIRFIFGDAGSSLVKCFLKDNNRWNCIEHQNTLDVELLKLINGFGLEDLILFSNRQEENYV
ncbi:MAG: hypothetical protein P4L49_05255 [Desulfosporosinus sp.]|nr:hypothetical protein [Desulfosporosinus sp.]